MCGADGTMVSGEAEGNPARRESEGRPKGSLMQKNGTGIVSRAALIDDAIAALDLKLTADEMAYLEEPYVPHAQYGFR